VPVPVLPGTQRLVQFVCALSLSRKALTLLSVWQSYANSDDVLEFE